jgi:hypothetical protein
MSGGGVSAVTRPLGIRVASVFAVVLVGGGLSLAACGGSSSKNEELT